MTLRPVAPYLVLLGVLVGAGAGGAQAVDSAGADQSPSAEVEAVKMPSWPSFERLPGADDAGIATLWRRGLRLEGEGRMLESAQVYEEIARRRPTEAHTYWRIARNYWNHAAGLPEDDAQGRGTYLALTEQWADRGLAVDDDCGECRLYKVGAMGARLQDAGALPAARRAAELAALLERGIELIEATPDARQNPELEELYYAAAQLYRRMPDWFWLGWVIGVRGDRDRALDYMRKAAALAGDRPKYQVELGAALVCIGRGRADAALIAEGRGILDRVSALEGDEHAVERRHARRLAADPEAACAYSRSDWLREESPKRPVENVD